MNYEKKYNDALKRAKAVMDVAANQDEARGIATTIFPELRKKEKPLTPFQQCLNCILRGVYYAEVPDKKVNEFILNVVRTRTDELIKLAKRHEYTDCQFRENEDERIRKALIDALKVSETIGELKFRLPYPTREECIAYLEKQKEHHIPWYDYQKSKEAGYTIVPNEEYEQLIKQKEQKPAEKQDYSGLTDLERAIHWGFLSAGVENVPVTIIKDTAQDCLAQMMHAEWSEEDERMVKFYEDDYNNNLGDMPMRDVIENRIKFKDWLLNRLKSIRPSWKPSEEQMEALEVAFRKNGDDEYRNIINSLYNDLKKL